MWLLRTRPAPCPRAPTRPRESVAGLAIAAAALLVMPGLAVAKRATGQALGNRTLVADSAESALCAATLLGVGLNTWLGCGKPTPSPGSSSPPSPSRKVSKPSKTTTEPLRSPAAGA
jgi:hypothetical protein